MKDYLHLDIDYLTDSCTGIVAYVIKGVFNNGKFFSYTSPFVFQNAEDAYHEACIELSGK